jgi:8-oxo-dGTP pyrophosphatase MutT (NUDIX family)
MATSILESERIAPWCNTVKLTFFAATTLEDVPRDQISCAFVLPCNPVGDIELGMHKTRGWDILGGHVEAGETPIMAALRELEEESGRVLQQSDLKLFGYERLVDSGSRRSLKHPHPVSYFIYYVARNVDSTQMFHPRASNADEEEEMTHSRFFTLSELADNKWFAERPAVLQALEKGKDSS